MGFYIKKSRSIEGTTDAIPTILPPPPSTPFSSPLRSPAATRPNPLLYRLFSMSSWTSKSSHSSNSSSRSTIIREEFYSTSTAANELIPVSEECHHAVEVLCERMKYYPIALIVSRIGPCMYAVQYGGESSSYPDAHPLSRHAFSLYLLAIFGPLAGIGYFLIFLYLQPKAFEHFKTKLSMTSLGRCCLHICCCLPRASRSTSFSDYLCKCLNVCRRDANLSDDGSTIDAYESARLTEVQEQEREDEIERKEFGLANREVMTGEDQHQTTLKAPISYRYGIFHGFSSEHAQYLLGRPSLASSPTLSSFSSLSVSPGGTPPCGSPPCAAPGGTGSPPDAVPPLQSIQYAGGDRDSHFIMVGEAGGAINDGGVPCVFNNKINDSVRFEYSKIRDMDETDLCLLINQKSSLLFTEIRQISASLV